MADIVALVCGLRHYEEFDVPRLMAQTVARLRQLGAPTVIVVGPSPKWPDWLPTRIARAYAASGSHDAVPRYSRFTAGRSLRGCRASMRNWSDSAVASGGAYVSAFRLLCRGQRCTVLIDGEPVAFDTFHLTVAAARFIARAIQASLTQPLVTGATQ